MNLTFAGLALVRANGPAEIAKVTGLADEDGNACTYTILEDGSVVLDIATREALRDVMVPRVNLPVQSPERRRP